MIQSFRHSGLKEFWEDGSKRGISPAHAARLSKQLAQLNASVEPRDMNVPGWDFHPLKGAWEGRYAVSVNGPWRLTFRFEGPHAVLVDYQQYH
jgi:toxin HigB-1